MTMRRSLYTSAVAICLAGWFVSAPAQAQSVKINNHSIGGVVSGPHGPEAGVWVIAETHDLPTRYTKMVVTDDKGRYVVPDLPQANITVWVRGYGLIDSAKVDAEPGKQLNLTAVPAPNDAAAAQYYPAIYWYSMLKIPGADQFGGKSDIPDKAKQSDWLNAMKNNGCIGCHQLGELATRTLPAALGKFKSSEEAWARRVQSGQAGTADGQHHRRQFNSAPIKYFADWTDRIAKGELPPVKPQRPQGIERNIVVTTWDWADDKHYLARRDFHRQAPSDGQRLRPDLRLAGIFDRQHPDPRSGEEQRRRIPCAGARSGHAVLAGPRPCRGPEDRWRPRPIGATSRSGTPTSTTTTR